jgi:6-phospho-beta-glucosidase
VTVRVAVLGGGGFRTPLVYESVASAVCDGAVDEVVLLDPEPHRLACIEPVIRGLRGERGGGPAIRTTTSLEEAVDDASFVFCAIRVGGLEARIVDETVPLELGVLGQETVGPGGIAFALRTVPVMDAIAGVVARRAPDAWFLNFTNPAGLVTEAVTETLGRRVVGICDSPSALCARVAAALGRSMSSLSFDYAGLNHLGWLMRVVEGGRNLLPDLLADEHRMGTIEETRLFGPTRLRKLAMIPNEYVVYMEHGGDIAAAMRREGSRGRVLAAQQAAFYRDPARSPADALAAWRAAKDLRHGTYMAEVWSAVSSEEGPGRPAGGQVGAVPAQEGPGEAGYAAIAASFLRAVGGSRPRALILDTANGSRMPFLDPGAVVEAPAMVGAGAVVPLPVGLLPPEQRDLVARVKDVERTTIRAARDRSASLALEAIAAHPVVPSREIAERILAGYLDRHPDLRERLR